jgi:metal-responsive CopG/Arc/MetJ family transcriptional regulator
MYMKKIEAKQTLSITIPITLYQRLQQEVGKGKISRFIKQTVEEKLTEQENKLAQEYRECYTNTSHLLEEAKL